MNINDWNQILTNCLAICAFLGTLKFMKLLRFNAKINYFKKESKPKGSQINEP